MLPENLLQLFNPSASINLSEYIKFRSVLETLKEFGNPDITNEEKKVEGGNIDLALFTSAMDLKQKYILAANEVKMRLIKSYFLGISDSDLFENFDNLWIYVGTTKPSLISFFFLPKIKIQEDSSSVETPISM